MRKKELLERASEVVHQGLSLLFEDVEMRLLRKEKEINYCVEIRFPSKRKVLSTEPIYIANRIIGTPTESDPTHIPPELQKWQQGIELLEQQQQETDEYILCRDYNHEILEQLTAGIQSFMDGDKDTHWYVCPEPALRKLKRAPKRDRASVLEKTGYHLGTMLLNEPKTSSQIILVYLFAPLTTNLKSGEVYYSLLLSLFFPPTTNPENFPPEQRLQYWKDLLAEYAIQTNSNSSISKETDGITTTLEKNNELVKVSLHSQLQKHGRGHQLSLLDVLQEEPDTLRRESLERKIYDNLIEAVGIDLTISQEKALFAVQKLLTATEYKGTEKKTTALDGKNPFLYTGHIPIIKFQTTEYLEAYGVTKFKSGRGKMEYSAAVRNEALLALRELADKRFLLCYTRKYWKESGRGKKQELYDIIRTITPLIQIIEGYEALTKSQSDIVTKGGNTPDTDNKLTMIAIEPNPILVDQLDTYFVLKPANCYQEIQLKFGKTSKYVYRFIDFLITEAAHRERKGLKEKEQWVIQRNWRNLAQTLRMDSWLNSRQWKAIRGSLDKSYAIAKELGYLTNYESGVEGKTKKIDRLHLNPDKFRHVQEVEKRRQEIESNT